MFRAGTGLDELAGSVQEISVITMMWNDPRRVVNFGYSVLLIANSPVGEQTGGREEDGAGNPSVRAAHVRYLN